MITPEELLAIKARAEKATPIPWQIIVPDGFGYRIRSGLKTRYFYAAAVTYRDDAVFIACAREDIPALVAEVEKLQAEIERLHLANHAKTIQRDNWERLYYEKRTEAELAQNNIVSALELLANYGQTDGDHHKAWVIDQVVRALTGDKYAEWVASYELGDDEESNGDVVCTWDEGIAP